MTNEGRMLHAALDALAFYADAENWKATVVAVVPKGEPNEGAVTMQSGPANDGGEHAREAIKRMGALA